MEGIFYGATGNAWIKPSIQWSAQANAEGNYSDVTATLRYTRTNYGYTTYGHWAGALSIDGDTKQGSGIYTEIRNGGDTAVLTHSVRVSHDDWGQKTVTIAASGSIPGTTLNYTAISAEIKLEDIPRAASIRATDALVGGISRVSIGRTGSRYTHTVAYRFGECAGYLTEAGLSDSPVQLTGEELAFSIPESFYAQLPQAQSGECILTCTTWLEDTQIGLPQQARFTVGTDPALCAPVLSAQAVDTNPVTVALTGDSGKAVRYGSDMVCSLTCRSRHGAVITEKKIAGVVVTGDTLTLSGYDAAQIPVSVQDSRGYRTELTLIPERIDYYPPTGILRAERTDATSGGARLTVSGSFYPGSFGAADNALQLRYRVGSGSWTALEPTVDGADFRAEAILEGLVYTSAHRIEVELSDALSLLKLQTTVNPGVPVFDWGREDFCFRVPVSAPRLTGLAAPAEETDAVNKAYADSKLSRSGGSMSGNRITELAAPVEAGDAVNKAYADTKTGMTLLWANASPGSSFPEQTLPLDWSKYALLKLFCRGWYSADSAEVVAKVGEECSLCCINPNDNGTIVGFSRGVSVTADGLWIGGCGGYSVYGSLTANDRLIPLFIYGVTGVEK